MNVWEAIDRDDQLNRLQVALAGTLTDIKDGVAAGDYELVRCAWSELEPFQKQALWTAKSKGGPFTQEEKRFIREAELYNGNW